MCHRPRQPKILGLHGSDVLEGPESIGGDPEEATGLFQPSKFSLTLSSDLVIACLATIAQVTLIVLGIEAHVGFILDVEIKLLALSLGSLCDLPELITMGALTRGIHVLLKLLHGRKIRGAHVNLGEVNWLQALIFTAQLLNLTAVTCPGIGFQSGDLGDDLLATLENFLVLIVQ